MSAARKSAIRPDAISGQSAILRPSVVLVADRTLAAEYDVLFEGIFAAMQTTQAPAWLMRRLIAPPVATDAAGRAASAPLGLRRIEAAMLAGGLDAADVVCATPESLGRLVGPWTKLVGVSSGDPLGAGMTNTTTSSFYSGELYTRHWTAAMLARLARAKRDGGFRVIFGGPGAWQLASRPDEARRLGIDTVVEGYFEAGGVELLADVLAGRDLAPHVRLRGTGAADARPIRGRTLLGAVEISRGCGRGCSFCTIAQAPMHHFAPEMVLADLATNAAAGAANALLGSEDFFRYGAAGTGVNFAALAGLLEEVRGVRGLRFVQADHGNIASVAQLSVAELRELRRLMEFPGRCRRLWVNMGVESAAGRLVAGVAPGKIAPFRAVDWADVVRTAAARLAEAGFFAIYSIILGLPGETPQDVRATHRLAEELLAGPAIVFPVFYEPLPHETAAGARPFRPAGMWPEHHELFCACYEANFAKIPGLYRDNQRAGGVGWLKRMAIQLLGRAEVIAWRRRLRRLGRQLAAAPRRSGTP